MFKRNLLFLAVVVLGVGSLVAAIRHREHVTAPESLSAVAAQQVQLSETVGKVNEEFHAAWTREGVQPAGRASNLTIIRRISLALTGTVPSLEEIRAVEAIAEDQQLNWWLAHLLEDRRTSDYVAERLTRAYVGTDDGPFLLFRRRRFATWLSDQLQANQPYDQIVRTLISDTGLWTDTPSVNFVTATLDQNKENQPDPIRLAGRTCRAFLGMRIDCLQCHDDHIGTIELGTADSRRQGTQHDFHHLAAFFSETRTSLLGIHDQSNAAYRYKFLKADEEEVVPPEVPFGREWLQAGGTRRERLAKWVTSDRNRPFARATVNRFWALMFGKPLVDPVDDIPLFGEYPPGLELLADDFVQHGFDVRRLLGTIVALEVFQMDSRLPEGEPTDKQEQLWAIFPLTRLRPEQVAGSLLQAASLETINAQAHIVSQLMRFFQQRDFVARYGDMGQDEFEDRGGTVTQRLLLMNGQLVKDRTAENPVLNAATRIAQLCPGDDKAVEAAYLAILTRRPSTRESTHFQERLQGIQGTERIARLEDLYWILINSTEFSWNH